MYINLKSNSLHTGIYQYVEFNLYPKFSICENTLSYNIHMNPTIYIRIYMHLRISIIINIGLITISL